MFKTKLFNEFFTSERIGGLVLIIATIISLTLANFGLEIDFHQHWLGLSIQHWINDGLMTIFFLMIGLELEREFYEGELSSIKNSLLPIIAAVGGMAVPAAIHFAFNYGTEYQAGAGIPMATDIAFALGILSLFRVPYSLKVFFTALAIVDDLGAILVIAIFYTQHIDYYYLAGAIGTFALLGIMNRLRIQYLVVYLIGGLLMWWCFLHSGVHATISGVLLAFAIPFSRNVEDCISHKLQHRLHLPVALVILPVFAFANTFIKLDPTFDFTNSNVLGIVFGLVVGKPLGILAMTALAIYARIAAPLPLSWQQYVGAGLLAGIGFTMSIFVALLAFADPQDSQLAVLVGSTVSAILGIGWFLFLKPELSDEATQAV